jgi:hypothetical protein
MRAQKETDFAHAAAELATRLPLELLDLAHDAVHSILVLDPAELALAVAHFLQGMTRAPGAPDPSRPDAPKASSTGFVAKLPELVLHVVEHHPTDPRNLR